MAVEIEIIEHEAFLEVLVTGVYDLEEAADRTSVILLACRTSGKSKVFIDSTGLIPTTSAVEKVLYVSYLREHYENQN